jgi:hypothetical protein
MGQDRIGFVSLSHAKLAMNKDLFSIVRMASEEAFSHPRGDADGFRIARKLQNPAITQVCEESPAGATALAGALLQSADCSTAKQTMSTGPGHTCCLHSGTCEDPLNALSLALAAEELALRVGERAGHKSQPASPQNLPHD